MIDFDDKENMRQLFSKVFTELGREDLITGDWQ